MRYVTCTVIKRRSASTVADTYKMPNEYYREINVTGIANGDKQVQGAVNYFLAKVKSLLEQWQDEFKTVAPCHHIIITIKREKHYEQKWQSKEGASDKN